MKFYRYYSVYYEGDPKVHLEELHMLKETLCGWWIIDNANGLLGFGIKPKWVSKTSKKRYAYPTKKEALHSFKFRKIRQIKILKARLLGAQHEMDVAKHLEVTE